ncbi:protein phosphatase 2C 70 isoform X2 [Dendrobium catenatum]|uniref:protein phosphatase 2C 70 isoform X2 n=1 Tax=Dendrobium catenatum TaxID=906689 RepID=UPI00109F4FED|nr:protein phosphatase 2C 70 isoform X2 [Dendrobium catenatum]
MEMRPFQRGVLGPSPLLPEAGNRGELQAILSSSMAASLAGLFLLMFLLFLLFILACRPWRFVNRRRSSTSPFFKVDDIEQPLFAESSVDTSEQCNNLARNFVEESNIQIDGITSSPKTVGVDGNINSNRKHGFAIKKRVSTNFQVGADCLVLDVITDASDNLRVGQTLKRLAAQSLPCEGTKHIRWEDSSYDSKIIGDNGRTQISTLKDVAILRSSINLEVIAGPSAGLHCSRYSKDSTALPLTLGRVSPSDLILKDSEVSGKHALINWNVLKSKWELVDLGSLNGTFLNSKAIHHLDVGSRSRSEPFELSSGDLISLGSFSKISVQIVQDVEYELPFGVGIACDPMAMRRGGKKLPMEDMCYCRWPLPGIEQFGFFSIFDGHGGAGAARAASKLLPQIIVNILSNPEKKQRVITCCDASDVLKEAFSLTEAALNHQYEGCTATILLLWFDYDEEMFVQCANVGDSACILDANGRQITMTEDHRVTSISERTRLSKAGMPLEGETRLCGLNLGRMLGDKFLKEQDRRFSAEPYVSQVVHITKGRTAFGLIASDGLWDVISTKQALQLVIQYIQTKERCEVPSENSAERIANYVLSEARTLRTKDNTSVIFLDFDLMRIDYRKHN